MSVALSLTHLRIDLIARSQIHLGGYQAGERMGFTRAAERSGATSPATRCWAQCYYAKPVRLSLTCHNRCHTA